MDNLPQSSKLPGKFQRFSVVDGSIKILKVVKFPNISIKMKNFKTFYNSQTLKKKIPLGDLQEYIDLCFPSASRMQLLDV